MSFFTNNLVNSSKLELKSKYRIYLVLQHLTSHVTLKINGSLTSEDIIRTVVSLAVDKNSVHSVSKQYSERFTVSVLPVEKDKTMVEYLSYFIDLINKLNFKIKVLCLDREFYSIDVFELLQKNGVPHIVPVVRKGEKMKQILKGNKARGTQYVMKNSKKKILLDIIIDVKYLKGKRDKKGCENLGFVVFGVK